MATVKGKYRAPALQKGLEILEFLAATTVAMPMSDISAALGRSVSEIFRMLQVLEEHGYIARSGEGYRLTNRLFALGMQQPPVRELLTCALPEMHDFAAATGQSCHLAIVSGAEMVVVANVEAPGLLGFAVRMGYRRPLTLSASGHVLLAFQPEAARAAMLRDIAAAGIESADLPARLSRVEAAGHVAMASPMLTAITDLSAPVLLHGAAQAALTVPFVDGAGAQVDRAGTTAALIAAAERISQALELGGPADRTA
ncbi:IclR family transcriptional regulator [Sphingomonas oligoaromativorans]|uniref:IclR family transcriptional regulator n=1 Tax=Sphingomonas oligoaromativorans TaxID=575322 RepID=UPI0031330E2F